MSNPNRILNHRALPPFINTAIKFKQFNNGERTDGHTFSQSSYNSHHKCDSISDEAVTSYLLNNPRFLESFLINNYSSSRLNEIIYKIPYDPTDVSGIPRRSYISTGIQMQNSGQQFVGFNRSSINSRHKKKYATPSTASIVSSMTLGLYPKPENILAINPEVTLIRFQSNSVYDDQAYAKLSHRFTSLEDTPAWTKKLLLSHKHINMMDKSDHVHSIQTKKQLLEDINQDVSTVISCDGGNLYFVDDEHQIIYLNNEARPKEPNIANGTTLAAYVANKRTGVMTTEVFMDDRFPDGILRCNSFVQAAMAQPIIMNNDELVGVIEIYKGTGKPPFSEEEEHTFRNYCMWASIAVFYNEIYLFNKKQQQLNSFLLNVTQKMFGKFQTIDGIIKDIMASAKSLVQADRVSLFLTDKTTQSLASQILDKGSYKECIFEVKPSVIRIKIGEGIAGYVAATGETLNISDAYKDERFNKGIDMMTGYVTKNILTMPVKLNEEIIGVVQMLNKKDGNFTVADEMDFRTFATYCGMALHIAKMYEKILRSQQKYKVALDVLSYHSGYTEEEFLQLRQKRLPNNIADLNQFQFWPWIVNDDDQPLYAFYMFKELFEFELFDEETIMKFVLTVKRNYRHVPYHNWTHAFSVAHSMFVLLKTCTHSFNLYESLALYIGCLCHDLDHRGKTNEYMVQSSSPLSAMYSTSTMEHHHFNMTVTILQRDGHNIFKNLSSHNYRKVLGHIKHCILATDLAKFFEYKVKLESSVEYLNPELESNRLIHMALTMTLCDLCSMYKSWEMQLSLVMIIMKEFWNQGDEERSRGQTPMKMLDRDYKLDLPECQVAFLRDVCLPCYKLVGLLFPACLCVTESAQKNLSQWQDLAALPDRERTEKISELEFFVDEFVTKYKLNFK